VIAFEWVEKFLGRKVHFFFLFFVFFTPKRCKSASCTFLQLLESMKSDGVTGDWFSGGEKIYCPFNFLVHDYYICMFDFNIKWRYRSMNWSSMSFIQFIQSYHYYNEGDSGNNNNIYKFNLIFKKFKIIFFIFKKNIISD
jgi:hypothetical protein